MSDEEEEKTRKTGTTHLTYGTLYKYIMTLRLPLEISVKRSSILHRQESRVEYSMSKEMQNTTLCKKSIKLCKSNFYRMELCVTQVEVRNTLNG